jgi:hypothetical protein
MIFNDTIVVLAADAQPGLFPAREQMAVSLGWHIIFQPHIQRRLCWNDHQHETEDQ